MAQVPGTEPGSAANRFALALAALATAAGLTLLGVGTLQRQSVPSAAGLDHRAPIPTATSTAPRTTPAQAKPQPDESRPAPLSTTQAQSRPQQGGSRPAHLTDHRAPDTAAA